mgnify:FL=1
MTNSNLVSLFYDKDTNISRKELAMRYVNLYFVIVGGLANITNDMILKAIEQLKTNKKLYRQSVKFHINRAEASSRVVVSSFRQGSFEVGAMTIYDSLLHEIRNILSYDIVCQQTTISNLLLKAKADNVYIKSAILVALQFARLQDYLSKEIEALVNSQGFRGNMINRTFSTQLYGAAKELEDTAYAIMPEDDVCDIFDDNIVKRSIDVIVNRITNMDYLNKASSKCVNAYNLPSSVGEEFNNAYTEWTEMQTNLLKKRYHFDTDEHIAKILGRSVGSIKAKARRLGLKRKTN